MVDPGSCRLSHCCASHYAWGVRILLTGHTGFKGAWMTLLLQRMGHRVSGFALDPLPGSLFEVAHVHDALDLDVRADIRDSAAITEAVRSVQPDFVVHMAAQPLVRLSYVDPVTTVETNVLGTLRLLEALRSERSQTGCLVVTTDKVYRNDERLDGYVEWDPLGGNDPYSASKAMADILTRAYGKSFDLRLAVARAGNVVGGGDISADRLLPDLIRGFASGQVPIVRNPHAVRPWQHVLDCLNGYCQLIDAMQNGSFDLAWNFGPDPSSFRTVADAATCAAHGWGASAEWRAVPEAGAVHETTVLTLNAERARATLNWRDRLSFDEAITWTIDWAKAVADGSNPRDVTETQIRAFEKRLGGAQ